MQIGQFFIDMYIMTDLTKRAMNGTLGDCGLPPAWGCLVGLGLVISYLILFFNYSYHAYFKRGGKHNRAKADWSIASPWRIRWRRLVVVRLRFANEIKLQPLATRCSNHALLHLSASDHSEPIAIVLRKTFVRANSQYFSYAPANIPYVLRKTTLISISFAWASVSPGSTIQFFMRRVSTFVACRGRVICAWRSIALTLFYDFIAFQLWSDALTTSRAKQRENNRASCDLLSKSASCRYSPLKFLLTVH